jgi:hypothetical protein
MKKATTTLKEIEHMEIEQQNVFDFPEPENLYSTVWMYRVHMPVLLIRVHKPNETDYISLFFENPVYFQGKMNWKGARFDVATTQECEKLFRQVTGQDATHPILPATKLYVVDTGIGEGDDSLVKIIAMHVYVTTKDYKIGDFFA